MSCQCEKDKEKTPEPETVRKEEVEELEELLAGREAGEDYIS